MRKRFYSYSIRATLACLVCTFVAYTSSTFSQEKAATQAQSPIETTPAIEQKTNRQPKIAGALFIEEKMAQFQAQAAMKKQQLEQLESIRQSLLIESRNEEENLALARELAAVRYEDLQKRFENANVEVNDEEQIYAQLDHEYQAFENLAKAGTVSKEEVSKKRLELQQQKKALHMARAKLDIATVELKSARIAEQAAHLAKDRQLESVEQKRDAADKKIAAAQAEHAQLLEEIAKLASQWKKADSDGAISLKQLQAMPREELRVLLEKQFDEDRALIADEIAELRARIEKLEKSESEKRANKTRILEKRLESILKHKDE